MSNKKKFVAIFIVLLIIITAIFVISKIRSNDNSPSSAEQINQINYDPPTEDDKKAAEDNKQVILEKEQANQQNQNDHSQLKKVVPTITYADQYNTKVEVGGFVSGLFEDGGICTAVFTNGANSLTRTSNAVKGANSVDCPVIEVNVTDFANKGTWNVVLKYGSKTAQGSSENKTFEVK